MSPAHSFVDTGMYLPNGNSSYLRVCCGMGIGPPRARAVRKATSKGCLGRDQDLVQPLSCISECVSSCALGGKPGRLSGCAYEGLVI